MAQFMIIFTGFGVVASASILLNSGILSILDGIALVLICGMIITAIIVMIQIWYFQSYQFQITKILIFIGLGLELAAVSFPAWNAMLILGILTVYIGVTLGFILWNWKMIAPQQMYSTFLFAAIFSGIALSYIFTTLVNFAKYNVVFLCGTYWLTDMLGMDMARSEKG